MDLVRYGLILGLGNNKKINYHSSKKHTKISIIAKFSCEISQNAENIAMRNCQILHNLVLRAEMCN